VIRAIDRLCLLLASSDFSDKELREMVSVLERVSPAELARVVERLRTLAAHEISRLRKAGSHTDLERSGALENRTGIATRVERLLRGDAGLSSSQAIKLLVDVLITGAGIPERMVRPRARETLRQWVLRISSDIPPSELLHYASALRNQLVHASPSDWPLRDRE
jgi:hypothetical protein